MRNLFISTFTIVFFGAYSQTNVVPNQLIIQLAPQFKAVDFTSEYSLYSLSLNRELSKHNNIYLIDFDTLQYSNDYLIELLSANNNTIAVQKNHILTKRLIPNDIEYPNQWQYFQANDKDIDADEAWNITTGGKTFSGDTIVACIIDDGINLSHPDIIPNLWLNKHEIPNNNIDDDGNGYIDDVRGWNAYDLNDDISHDFSFWEGHGSPVAGIVGAKGNDSTGVTGVNWDIKLMIVKGGGNEAEAIAAYSYALENRILYNQTNGQKGAYVVVTNSSWGVDYGRAANAPIWCAFYDTLGNYGILSAGATINESEDVDKVGDLPTECASNYLVTVTNTNIYDNKEMYAGYGDTTIDLGSPGEGVWTIGDPSFGSNLYDSFGGTSAATPHVAGAIALLYSAPCSGFASLINSNPKLAAEKVKGYILDGAEPNSSLSGITVTGGRLNIKNSLDLLMNEFGCTATSINKSQPFQMENIVIFPNPLNDIEFEILNLPIISGENKIRITNLDGKTIYENIINSKKVKLPSLLANGTYLIYITDINDNIFYGKIIVNN